MDTTIDELRAGWEQVREQVKQLLDENRELKNEIGAHDRAIDDLVAVNQEMNELLWWLTAEANRVCLDRYGVGKHGDTVQLLVASVVRQMLATQGYTRENLEKR